MYYRRAFEEVALFEATRAGGDIFNNIIVLNIQDGRLSPHQAPEHLAYGLEAGFEVEKTELREQIRIEITDSENGARISPFHRPNITSPSNDHRHIIAVVLIRARALPRAGGPQIPPEAGHSQDRGPAMSADLSAPISQSVLTIWICDLVSQFEGDGEAMVLRYKAMVRRLSISPSHRTARRGSPGCS